MPEKRHLLEITNQVVFSARFTAFTSSCATSSGELHSTQFEYILDRFLKELFTARAHAQTPFHFSARTYFAAKSMFAGFPSETEMMSLLSASNPRSCFTAHLSAAVSDSACHVVFSEHNHSDSGMQFYSAFKVGHASDFNKIKRVNRLSADNRHGNFFHCAGFFQVLAKLLVHTEDVTNIREIILGNKSVSAVGGVVEEKCAGDMLRGWMCGEGKLRLVLVIGNERQPNRVLFLCEETALRAVGAGAAELDKPVSKLRDERFSQPAESALHCAVVRAKAAEQLE